jgi:hypothetical protein
MGAIPEGSVQPEPTAEGAPKPQFAGKTDKVCTGNRNNGWGLADEGSGHLVPDRRLAIILWSTPSSLTPRFREHREAGHDFPLQHFRDCSGRQN